MAAPWQPVSGPASGSVAPQLGATGAWWQGGQAPPPQLLASLAPAEHRPAPMLASHLAHKALDVADSDDELIGADPDE
ncbi:unnamed protein product, partial [Polarella glacialis]